MNYKYSTGDKVLLRGKKYMVLGRYYPNGVWGAKNPIAYSIYPPGKKTSYGYHCWAYEKDLIQP